MNRFCFSKKLRLNKSDIKNILLNFNILKFGYIKIIYKKNNFIYPRLGFILKKKILKNHMIEIYLKELLENFLD